MSSNVLSRSTLFRRSLFVSALALLTASLATASPAANEGTEMLTDNRVRDAVEDEIFLDPAVPFDKIDVRVNEGIVTLSGDVPSLLARERAVRLAESVKGVRSIVDRMAVRPRVNPSAKVLRDQVNDALLIDPATESFEIRVSADDSGNVTLTGTVDSWQERELAGTVAKGVIGVRSVENDVSVLAERKRADLEIQRDVEAALRWDALVDHLSIDVSVGDGVVTLEGSVASASERRHARSDAWVSGVTAVKSEDLRVTPWLATHEKRESRFVSRTDEEIADAVEDALLWDPRVASYQVETHAHNGVVTLRGTVDNLKAKRAASQDARNTLGVLDVKNRLRVRTDEPIADETLEARVRQALLRDPIVERFEVSVRAADGTVYLYGDVDTFYEKGRADDVASRTKGVVAVINDLDVSRPWTPLLTDPYIEDWSILDYDWYDYRPIAPARSDAAIEQAVKNQLWWSPFVDADQVEVTVDDGVVRLTGAVDSLRERRAAAHNAYEGGASWVNNDLEIR